MVSLDSPPAKLAAFCLQEPRVWPAPDKERQETPYPLGGGGAGSTKTLQQKLLSLLLFLFVMFADLVVYSSHGFHTSA